MKFKKQAETAAGARAVYHALRMATKVMTLGKSFNILGKLNQKEGIDCPGCAWPDPEHGSSLGEYCENGVKAIAEEAMDASADTVFFEKHAISFLRDQSDYWLGQQGRLVHPMIIRKGDTHYSPIKWEDAFELVADELKALPSPDDAIFYTSGRTSNEAAFLYQLFTRIFGTNNLPDCSNMCHESSGVALNHTIGIGKGTVKLEDFYKSDLILILGQNPGTNHPRMLSALEKAKANGAKVVVINPLREAGLLKFKNPQTLKGILGGADIADLYLQIKINEDVSLLKVLNARLMALSKEQPEVIDQSFIKTKTDGFNAFKKELESIDQDALIKRTGLESSDVDTLIEWVASSTKIISCWAMGLTQHENAVDNIQELVNMTLLKGSIGKEGAGLCPVRGHSNVQGDRTMGIWEKPSKEFLETLSSTFNFTPPIGHGVDVVESIKAMKALPGKVFMSMGGNFLSAAPDTPVTAKALASCKLTVHVSTKLNRSHLHHGDVGLIFPCLGRTDRIEEKSGPQKLTVENSMGLVHTTTGNMEPRSEALLSEPHIIAQLASRTVGDDSVNWTELIDDYDNIRDLIGKSVKGFERFNERLNMEKIIELPNGPREGIFTNDIGLGRFTINKVPAYLLADDELLMMTIRSHDQFNTTIYGLDDRYRGIFGTREVVLMNPSDVKKNGLKEGDLITLYNDYAGSRREVSSLRVVNYDIPKGCIATYFPECNSLIPLDYSARGSNTPASKSVAVRVRNLTRKMSSR